MFGLGSTELIILLIIVLVIFGAGKLPTIGRSLGTAITEFKDSIKPKDDEDEEPAAARPSKKADVKSAKTPEDEADKTE